jgi:proline racemase
MNTGRKLTAIDLHAGGIPGRVITGGVAEPPGSTVREKAAYLRDHHDELRQRMLNEPRGYPASCCNLIVRAADPRAALGFVIMEHVEYPSMSGSNTICVATAAIETGIVPVTEPVTRFAMESPAGLIEIEAQVSGSKATAITFRNVPAFVAGLDISLEVPGLGSVLVDVAWGGMFFVIADADQFDLRLTPDEGRDITRISRMLTLAAAEQYPVSHPDYPDVPGVTIAQLSGPGSPGTDRRNAVTMSSGPASWNRPHSFTGGIDRSPCGTGTSAKMATLHARGRLPLGRDFRHESIVGSVWTGRLLESATVAGRAAVIPQITGRAWITGFADYVLDPTDPFPNGFRVGDIWGATA